MQTDGIKRKQINPEESNKGEEIKCSTIVKNKMKSMSKLHGMLKKIVLQRKIKQHIGAENYEWA